MCRQSYEFFQRFRKKLVSSLESEHSEYERWKGDALIRSNFHIDPEELKLSQWAKLYAQATWLEKWKLENQAEILSSLFGKE